MHRTLCLFASFFFALLSCNHKTEKWKQVWADEFDYIGLPDSTKWGYDVGGDGWGNNELQYYTKADTNNAIVKNGELIITAKKQRYDSNNYTSARLITKQKGDWRYGKIEVKAKLPVGRGLWPAIWMLPTNWEYGDWPISGEIDIMEHVGYMPDSIFSSVHTKSFNHIINTQKTKGIFDKDVYRTFHIYSIEWYKEKIDFFVDGKLILSFSNTGKGFNEWPFDKNFHLLLNVAVGGNWGAVKGIDEAITASSMIVDYVRVYQQQEK